MIVDQNVGKQAAKELPELCFAFGADARPGQYVRAVRRGELGYSATTYDERDPTKAAALVKFMNEKLGVSDVQQECMVMGSMFGWDSPGANPALVKARSDAKTIKPGCDLPWMIEGSGRATIYAASGDRELPDKWTGICVVGNDLKKFWYVSQENGERAYNALRATTYEAAIREVEIKHLSMESRFTNADADRLLGLADQFLEDWEENEGKTDAACIERRTEYDAIRPLLVSAPSMYGLCQQIEASKGIATIEAGVLTLENGEKLDFGDICARIHEQQHGAADVSFTLPNDVAVVTAGRHIGTVSEVTGQFVMQNSGRGKVLAHQVARFDVVPKVGDVLDVEYKGGKAVVAEVKERGKSNER